MQRLHFCRTGQVALPDPMSAESMRHPFFQFAFSLVQIIYSSRTMISIGHLEQEYTPRFIRSSSNIRLPCRALDIPNPQRDRINDWAMAFSRRHVFRFQVLQCGWVGWLWLDVLVTMGARARRAAGPRICLHMWKLEQLILLGMVIFGSRHAGMQR